MEYLFYRTMKALLTNHLSKVDKQLDIAKAHYKKCV